MNKWYFEINIKRFLRLIRSIFTSTYNVLRYGYNGVDILSYKKKKYADTIVLNEYQNTDAYYGISTILRKYSGYRKIIAATIEHGVYFGTVTSEVEEYNLPCVITFSDERKKELRKITDRPIYVIGPYILYADSILKGDEFNKIKSKLGTTLLVVPSHGLEKIHKEYSQDLLIEYIISVSKEYEIDTILVSLYFADIERYAKYYERMGWQIVCSGYRTDTDFLNRQRTIMEISDYVITNNVGTHIGYAVALNKPVSFFRQDIVTKALDGETVKHLDPFEGTPLSERNKNEIIDAFNGFHTRITDIQYNVIDKYWGLSKHQTPEEIKYVFEMMDKIWKTSRKLNYREDFLRITELEKNIKIPNLLD